MVGTATGPKENILLGCGSTCLTGHMKAATKVLLEAAFMVHDMHTVPPPKKLSPSIEGGDAVLCNPMLVD